MVRFEHQIGRGLHPDGNDSGYEGITKASSNEGDQTEKPNSYSSGGAGACLVIPVAIAGAFILLSGYMNAISPVRNQIQTTQPSPIVRTINEDEVGLSSTVNEVATSQPTIRPITRDLDE